MNQWWNETPNLQRFVILGLVMVLFVLGMHTWVWSSLDSSIAMVNNDLSRLNQKNQESIQSIASLKDLEQEVVALRRRLPPTIQQFPVRVEPESFRRDIVSIGKQAGVAVRLWNPQKPLMDDESPDGSLQIVVRVEGSFYGTVQFLRELLQLSWVQTVNPLVLIRKEENSNSSVVTTDFTIKGLVSKRFQQTKEMLKT